MGNTQYSVATVLTLFMGGLAVGSFWGGKLVDRSHSPLKIYAVLEVAIGLFCLLVPVLIDSAFPIFQFIYLSYGDNHAVASLLRFLVCGVILLIPTSLMGATLPVLGKFVSNDPAFIGRDVGSLYSANTFGAVIGAFVSGIVLIRLFGVQASIGIAAFFNLFIAWVVWFLFLRQASVNESGVGGSDSDVKTPPTSWTSEQWQVLMVFFVSGACAMIYQLAWNRIFSLLLGSSIYAFSLILTTFILGLALGAVVFSRWVNRFQDLPKVFAVMQAVIGLSALLALPFFGDIPFLNRWVYQNLNYDFILIQGFMFLVIFSLLFIPTFFMGGQFPVVVKILIERLSNLGENVGRVYASNTIGSIAGSFVAGFVLIPIVGIQNSILTAIMLNLTLAVILLWKSPSVSSFAKIYIAPILLLACLAVGKNVPAWDKAVISSGSFMPYRIEDLSEAEQKKNKILFYKEGMHTTVTVELSVSGNVFLRVNGKTDASLALDMRTQLLSGYLPMVLHENPQSALVVGQGSGITLGAVEQFPVKEIDLVEISSAVIEGSRFFDPFNHQALDDPRVNLIVEDGRNHIALTDKKYDVIISEPSNPWISGVGALFTKDFFELAQSRLAEKGILCIWVHTNMSPDGFRSIVKSFSEIFPVATMWESIVGDDYLLIGSNTPYAMNYETVEGLIHGESTRKDLNGVGIFDVSDLMSLMTMGREGLLKFSEGAMIHTDDNSLLEFSAPQYIYKDERSRIVSDLTPFFSIDPKLVRFTHTLPEEQDRILQHISGLKRSESQMAEIKRNGQIELRLEQGKEAVSENNYALALQRYKDILTIDPDHVLALYNMGSIFSGMNEPRAAIAAFERTLEINPHYLFGAIELAKAHLASGSPEEAVTLLRPLIAKYPADSELHLNYGLALAFDKQHDHAIREFQLASRLNPKSPLPHYYLGVEFSKSNKGEARDHLRRFVELAASDAEKQGMLDKARKLLNSL
ncbi:MAG: tetratricopeptide repeat protein [Candidatus Nitrohelix vancouverensis]|uniref:Tetratricopeptide repeat protein n=1 Tax=Candidatus Nitrohelix vancouverensis TaxID=2705534 RepID=A0A7T0G4T6_9BACT|nr:MAG: tetratricopeptide repeat protein [Candidatus Nitrohelix vancouverensis]